ncbi:(2Fe-2S)-binding protein [Pallidibacillus pasinlerensis]|jgi:sarcosine oxidase, subunit alpha|uniref:(2Fe-2S)-binding protein n=1 Tax=Pallidibacillus pasinlerensis TaxID=2703818 RepID=A0ABX0A3L4_9BACI|nr:(2Fe-2S)-binding protein [Pallidibacillus pasinlerensis]NCU18031.1 (2Fe-2S)-binding protein [Pallidibacillus pasinlerensis]
MNNRILNHPILGKLEKKKEVRFFFNNKEYKGYENESIAAALLANGVRTLRYHEETSAPRGIYCNIGHCFECRVIVNGKQGIRACLTPLKENMEIESHRALPTPVRDWGKSNE